MNRNPKDKTGLEKAISALRNDEPASSILDAAGKRVWQTLSDHAAAQALAPATKRIRGCADVQSLLPVYLAGKLDPAKALLVGDHVRECAECQMVSRRFQHREVVSPWRQSLPAISSGWGMRQFATAAVLLFVIGLSFYGVRQVFFGAPAGPRARVESVNGSVFLIASNADRPLLPGTEIAEGEAIRTGGASYATLRLSDGSVVEMNEQSEFSVSARRNDTTIHMQHGNIIVQAAKRRTGHLYVAAKDCRVSVTGTVFAVNSGVKGSRVSVMEGEVRVARAGAEDVLHSGDQTTTSSSITRVPVQDEIRWSRNFDKHLALLAEFSKLQNKLSTINTPAPRYDSRILPLVPQSTVLYASIPNYGEALNEAHQLLQQQLSESPVLRNWWAKQNATRKGPSLDEMINKIHTLSQYLGSEVVLTIPMNNGRMNQPPMVIAEVRRPGLRNFLEQEIANAHNTSENHGEVKILDDASLASVSGLAKDGMYILVREDFVVASPDANALRAFVQSIGAGGTQFAGTGLGQRMAAVYHEGAGILLGADLHSITQSETRHNADHRAQMQSSGFADMDYLVATRRENGSSADNRITLSFTGERHGIASWLAAPAPLSTLDFVSPDASAAAAITVKNPAAMFDDLLATIGNDEKSRRELQETESKLNIRLRDDLAGTLGNEFTIALDGPVLPTPSWKLIGQVYDQSRLQSTIATLVEDANRESSQHKNPVTYSLQQAQAEGRTYYSIQVRGEKFSNDVHYTFVDGYIVMAPSRAMVMQAIKTRESGATLPRSETFMSLLPTDGHTNFSGVIYQNLGHVFEPIAQQLNPNQSEKLQTIVANAKPSLICAYGSTNAVEMASTGFFGLDLNNLAIADVLRTVQGTKAKD